MKRDATSQPGGAVRETILLVEDEESVRRLAARVLRRKGFTILEAVDGEDALRVAETETGCIALLITDLIMPGVDGPELVKRLKPLRPQMRVLFMSGYLEEDLKTTQLNADAAFLGKPFLPDDLLRKAESMLAMPVEAN